MSSRDVTSMTRSFALARRVDPAVLSAFACIIVLLGLGGLYSTRFFSPEYLLQQLQVASFLGLVATGMMLIILLGHIDLSVPWVLTAGGMMSTAAVSWGGSWEHLAIPFGIGCGALFGAANGIGVAYLRIPAMIFTLGINAVAQGLMVLRTGGFAPLDQASAAMRVIATGRSLFGIPNAVLVWGAVGVATVFLLSRTSFGRAIYAIGNSERAAYLSGCNTRRVIFLAFVISGGLAGFAGSLLSGYSTKAYQSMGDPYLLPAIAAVVLGGTSILGGRGSYLGTVAGVILITLLQSILSVVQMPEAGRQIIYGAVIVAMLLVYGRGQRIQG
jgi:ribose transport system permease protein